MKVLQRLNFFILLVLILFTSYIRYFTDFYIFEDRSLLDALLISLFIIFLAYVINSLAGNLILRRVSTARDRYTLRKTVSILVTVLAFASLFAIWVERTSTLLIAYGILSAGVAIALQDVLRNRQEGF